MSVKETEPVINNLPQQKASGPDGITGEFYRTLKGEITWISYDLFLRAYAASIAPIPKPKTLQEKEMTDQYLEHRCTNTQNKSYQMKSNNTETTAPLGGARPSGAILTRALRSEGGWELPGVSVFCHHVARRLSGGIEV